MQQDSTQNRRSIRVPDLPEELHRDQTLRTPYCTTNTPPFFATSRLEVVEKDNTDPSFLRSTMYVIPASEYTMDSCSLPFSIMLTPFNGRGVIEEVSGVDQCDRCRSYLNCFTIRDSTSITCNICGVKCDMIVKYPENMKYASFETHIAPIATESVRSVLDADDETEGMFYPVVKELLKPCCVFMFDMTSFPLVDASLNAIVEITNDPNFSLLYENIGFFVLNDGLTAFSMCSGQIVKYRIPGNTPFISKKLLISSKDTESINSIVQEIRKSKERQPFDANTLIDSIKHVSSFAVGCKFLVFSSSQINLNYESILKEKRNCTINVFQQCAEQNKKAPMNNLEKLAFYSSGRIFRYTSNFAGNIIIDVKNTCLVRSVFDVKINLKVSDNITKKLFLGSSLSESLASSYMNHMDSDISVMFDLGIGGVSKLAKYVQLQVQYTDWDGSRRLRVFNHTFHTGTPSQIFNSISFDTLFASLVRLNISENIDIQKSFSESLVYYRNKCSSNITSTQFVLPDCLKCLPVLLQAMSKKKDLDKAWLINSTVEQNLRYFYPRLFSLSDYVMSGNLEKTKGLRLTVQNIVDDIYISENSQRILMFFPRSADHGLVDRLFDESGALKKSEDEDSRVVQEIVESIKAHYNCEMKVMACIAGEHVSEGEFMLDFIEDALNEQPDYVDYVFKLHFNTQKN